MSDSKTPRDERERGGSPRNETSGGERSRATNWLERLVTWTSGLLLLAAIVYLLLEGLAGTDPARFEAQPLRSWRGGEGHHVLLEVRNTGGTSVQNLQLTVELRDGERTVDQTRTGLSWLPAGSTREAVAIFGEDPAAYELEVSFDGYELP